MSKYLRRWQNGREIVKGPVTKKEYAFVTQHNICASLVDDEDVPGLLAMKAKCCGQTGNIVRFWVMDDVHIKRFQVGGA